MIMVEIREREGNQAQRPISAVFRLESSSDDLEAIPLSL
jgi:hypothetical protein